MLKKEKSFNEQPLEKTNQSSFYELYTNTALVNFSSYEFEITFGLGSSNYEGVRPVVNLRMSPQFAKEFAQIIGENVRLYEENIGKLPEQEKPVKRQ